MKITLQEHVREKLEGSFSGRTTVRVLTEVETELAGPIDFVGQVEKIGEDVVMKLYTTSPEAKTEQVAESLRWAAKRAREAGLDVDEVLKGGGPS